MDPFLEGKYRSQIVASVVGRAKYSNTRDPKFESSLQHYLPTYLTTAEKRQIISLEWSIKIVDNMGREPWSSCNG